MKKHRIVIVAVIHIIFVAVFTFAAIHYTGMQSSMTLSVHLGENHAGQRNIAQLFCQSGDNNPSIDVVFDDDVIEFAVNGLDYRNCTFRLDPVSVKEDFSIDTVTISFGKKVVSEITGKQFKETYVKEEKGVSCQLEGERLLCKSKKSNPRFILNSAFSERLYQAEQEINRTPYMVSAVLFGILCIMEMIYLNIGVTMEKHTSRMQRMWHGVGILFSLLLMGAGVLFVYILKYFEMHFGQVPIGQLIYHLHTPLEGTDVSAYDHEIRLGVALTVGCPVLCFIVYRLLKWKKVQRGFLLCVAAAACLLVSYSSVQACYHFQLKEYYEYTHSNTMLYEEHYVDGRDVELTFPETKRNLIYIFLESMEMTYSDTASGGAMAENVIPDLTDLALQHTCFSDGSLLNGAHHVCGATYTMGGIAAQTSGVPINETLVSNETLNGTWESENNYLPGVWSIGDILKEQGYQQEFLIGSNGEFAGRSSYFSGHGGYRVADYKAAQSEGRISPDYKVWWGYEDQKLFEFAKEDLLQLSKEQEPFNLTMLTVDTHPQDGYVCDLCKTEFDAQYSNVLACSSRQVAQFIDWIQQQDFYENTTIVLSGDHLLSDSYYIANQGAEGFDRRTYVAVINPADGKEYSGQSRIYTTLDLFPTTLSAMGVQIEGDRLGLGVNLYSDVPTLAEEYGMEQLNTELLKNSKFYTTKLLYKERS